MVFWNEKRLQNEKLKLIRPKNNPGLKDLELRKVLSRNDSEVKINRRTKSAVKITQPTIEPLMVTNTVTARE